MWRTAFIDGTLNLTYGGIALQFAYNEMSFFLVRLLQTFSDFSLDSNPPADARPPAEWAGLPGRKGMESCRPKTHLTLYAQVCIRDVIVEMLYN